MNSIATHKRSLAYIVMTILLLIGACASTYCAGTLYCCWLPQVVGQDCLDFVSGQVPVRAQHRFLERIFEATIDQDYEWLATVSDSSRTLAQLEAVQPKITKDWDIIFMDDLAGLYEYKIRFDNGIIVYVTLVGHWPNCPDFEVTDEEVFQNLRLYSIDLVAQ